MMALPELLHGEAVALDVLFSSRIACRRGLLDESDVNRIISVMDAMELPTTHRLFGKPDLLHDALVDTMRHRDGQQRLPMPSGLGNCTFLNDVRVDEIRESSANMVTEHE